MNEKKLKALAAVTSPPVLDTTVSRPSKPKNASILADIV